MQSLEKLFKILKDIYGSKIKEHSVVFKSNKAKLYLPLYISLENTDKSLINDYEIRDNKIILYITS